MYTYVFESPGAVVSVRVHAEDESAAWNELKHRLKHLADHWEVGLPSWTEFTVTSLY